MPGDWSNLLMILLPSVTFGKLFGDTWTPHEWFCVLLWRDTSSSFDTHTPSVDIWFDLFMSDRVMLLRTSIRPSWPTDSNEQMAMYRLKRGILINNLETRSFIQIQIVALLSSRTLDRWLEWLRSKKYFSLTPALVIAVSLFYTLWGCLNTSCMHMWIWLSIKIISWYQLHLYLNEMYPWRHVRANKSSGNLSQIGKISFILQHSIGSQGHDGFPSNSLWTVYRPNNIGHFWSHGQPCDRPYYTTTNAGWSAVPAIDRTALHSAHNTIQKVLWWFRQPVWPRPSWNDDDNDKLWWQ